MTPLEHALAYAERGWRVIPIPAGLKHPNRPRWQEAATTDAATITTWWTAEPAAGVGVATGPASGVFVVDVDPRHGGDETLAGLEATYGALPDTVETLTGGGGRHLWFAHPAGVEIRNDAGGRLGPGLDIRGDGGQVLAPPTVHPTTGLSYEWEVLHDPLDGVVVAEAPAWLVELLVSPPTPVAARRELLERPAGELLPGDWFATQVSWPELLEHDGWTLHSVRTSPGGGGAYELWTRPGKDPREGASASLYYAGSDVLKVHSTAPEITRLGLVPGDTYTRFGYAVATRWAGDFAQAAADVRARMPAEERIDVSEFRSTPPPAPAPAPASSTPASSLLSRPLAPANSERPDVDLTALTDLGNCRRLVASHGHDLRWAPELGTWLAWDGARWAHDRTGEAQRRAKATVDAMHTEIALVPGDEARKKLFGHWQRSQSSGRLEAMLSLARTEPGVPVLVRELDADPWLLNTRSGVLDLRTGALAGHERRHLVTRLAEVALDPAATCPTWEWFVRWAMNGDDELVGFLQRAVGYSLTGTVREQALFFLHGSGRNGKSTFLNVLQALFGDYAVAAEPDLLLATDQARHPTGMTDLVGRRLAVVQEVDEGRRLAEATVKQLTGGDRIRARRMREDFFEFAPTHKLWMAANHRPLVRGTDLAIWRRIKMVPFTATVAEADVDPDLEAKLVAELPGILNWALEGCRQWLVEGLREPAAVREATSGYRSEQDHVGRFLVECCELGEGLSISSKALRDAYEHWCDEGGERPWSAKAMAPYLTERGCDRRKMGRSNLYYWFGIALADGDATWGRTTDNGPYGPRSGDPFEDRTPGNGPNGPRSALDGAERTPDNGPQGPRADHRGPSPSNGPRFQPASANDRGPADLADLSLFGSHAHAHAQGSAIPENGPQGPRWSALATDEPSAAQSPPPDPASLW